MIKAQKKKRIQVGKGYGEGVCRKPIQKFRHSFVSFFLSCRGYHIGVGGYIVTAPTASSRQLYINLHTHPLHRKTPH